MRSAETSLFWRSSHEATEQPPLLFQGTREVRCVNVAVGIGQRFARNPVDGSQAKDGIDAFAADAHISKNAIRRIKQTIVDQQRLVTTDAHVASNAICSMAAVRRLREPLDRLTVTPNERLQFVPHTCRRVAARTSDAPFKGTDIAYRGWHPGKALWPRPC